MDNNNQPTQDKAPTPPPFKPETGNATTILSEWPGAFGIYEPSKKAVKLNLWLLVAVFLLSSLLSGITSSLNNSNGVGIGTLLSFLISPIITAMSSYILIESVRGKVTDFQTAFDKVSGKLLNIFVASILTGLISVASIICFIIPAFFIIPRINLVMYFVIDKDMDAVEALKASWKYMDGKPWQGLRNRRRMPIDCINGSCDPHDSNNHLYWNHVLGRTSNSIRVRYSQK